MGLGQDMQGLVGQRQGVAMNPASLPVQSLAPVRIDSVCVAGGLGVGSDHMSGKGLSEGYIMC